MKIERPLGKHKHRFLWIIATTFLFFIALIVLVNIFGETASTKPVNENWFGPYFVWPHVIILIGILGFVLFWWSIQKIFPHHQTISKFLLLLRKKTFNEQFNQVTQFIQLDKNKIRLHCFIMFSAPFLIPILMIFLDQLGGFWTQGIGFVGIMGLVAYTVLFFFLLGKINALKKSILEKVIKKLNETLPNTHLSFAKSQAAKRMNVKLINIEGNYKQHEIKTIYKGLSFSHLSIKIDTALQFSIKEKKPLWKKWEAKSLDELFAKRFELKGIDASKLPEKFKAWAVNYLGNLILCVQEGYLEFLKFKKGEARFSEEGKCTESVEDYQSLIMILDELVQVAQWLEN